MADVDEKAKAERLAVARKKYEAIKKQQQKGKKASAKKKDDKPEAEAEVLAPKEAEDSTNEVTAAGNDEEAPEEEANQSADGARPPHARQPSMSVQSKLRSESFRKAQSPTSPTLQSSIPPLSPGGEGAQEIYKKQAQRIEELQKDNKRLQSESQDAKTRWRKLEEDLQELREADSEAADLKTKAKQAEEKAEEVEKLKAEIASLQRQNGQLQSAASRRRISTSISPATSSTDDLNAQLASKSDTISSLELEISTLHSRLSSTQSANDSQSTKITTLESQLQKAEQSAASSSRELAELKANFEKASERAVADGSARSFAETRLAQLEAELGTARRSAEEASKRAETLEKKIETLTTLHRESDARNQSKIAEGQKQERDAKELRARVTALSNENGRLRDEALRRKKLEAAGDSGGLEELEDEERQRLQVKVRELEEEVFELRRGVWRDKRRSMQPGLDDLSTGFDDVDLSSNSPTSGKKPTHSSFQDVISSGISAFTGASNRKVSNAASRPPGRKQSLGLLEDDDDFAFDEDAFRKAQEDEAMTRLERVKEVKRGLKNWEGWKMDITDLRTGMGGVFEV